MLQLKFLGIYSTKDTTAAGTTVTYWFVWFGEESNVYISQKLSAAFQPIAKPTHISNEIFGLKFHAEENIIRIPLSTPKLESLVPPQEKKTDSFAERAVRTIQRQKVLNVDRKINSDFTKNLNRWNKGYKDSALKEFERLLENDENIEPVHKHSFSFFSSALRKNSQHELALRFSLRVVTLSPDDSHAYFNVGRIYFELEDYENARKYLEEALQREPSLDCAEKLLDALEHKVNSKWR